ncbi:hypothetical protein [Helicobacter bilis]|nr:hypothetical protein [Helicobacter bilis]MDD7296860.1 hypothetical protein [Helicobacter bilis]MDY4399769.1 hypothetical protein [Helicobacter bilis]
MLTIANLSGGTAMVIRYLELGNDIYNIYMQALIKAYENGGKE